MINTKKTVVAVLSDLMFTVKIQEAAKRAGLETIFVQARQDALAQAKLNPALIILDLNSSSADPLELISALKADEGTKGIDLLGYVSHVQVDVKQAAQERGCEMVIARSAFAQNLPIILKRYASLDETAEPVAGVSA